MFKSLLRRLGQASRRIHFRVILIAVLTLVALGLARFLEWVIPDWLADLIGAGAVDSILQILASSMLAVTIFSLTIMAGALQTAAGNWTPRSHLVLRQDTVTQSVLANFLGAFLFALVGTVMRAAGLFDDRGIVVLFAMALAVVALVVVSLIRWIVHLEGLGSLTFTASRLEDEACSAVMRSAQSPCHGAHALSGDGDEIPKGALELRAARSGYLQQIFEHALQDEAADKDLTLYLPISVGDHVLEGQVVAYVDGVEDLSITTETILRESLPLGENRSFQEDPVFGITVLSEVATRALSPGVNDPGTAVDVINRLTRVLAQARVGVMETPDMDRLWARLMAADALVRAGFDPVARCAGGALDVHICLQQGLTQLSRLAEDPEIAQAARNMAVQARARAEHDITFADDLDRLRACCDAQAAY